MSTAEKNTEPCQRFKKTNKQKNGSAGLRLCSLGPKPSLLGLNYGSLQATTHQYDQKLLWIKT